MPEPAPQRPVPATAPPRLPGMPGRGPGPGHGLGAPKVRPQHAGRAVSRVWAHFGGERRRLLLVLALVLVAVPLGMAGPYLLGRAIDAIAAAPGGMGAPGGASGGGPDLTTAVLTLLGAYAAGAALSTAQGWVMAGVSQRLVRNLRTSLFGKLQRLPLTFFDLNPHGEVMSRLTNDVDAVSVTVAESAVQLLSSAVLLIGTVTLMLSLNVKLTLVSLAPLPLVVLLTTTISRRTRRLFLEQQTTLGALNAHVEETVSGMAAVKAFGREAAVGHRFGELNDQLRRVGTRAQIITGFLMPMMNVIGNVGFAAVAVAGGVLATRGEITVGLIATFIAYARQLGRPLHEMAAIYNTLMAAVAGAERVFAVLDEGEEPADADDAVELRQPRGEVELRQVSFGYRPDVRVLQGICLQAPAGSVTAIVGRTGAGKTTIANLLARFYDPTEGAVLIDGIDARRYQRASLRRAFGVVLQDGWLFAGTVRDNIAYGRPDATDEEIRQAAALVGADRVIERLPAGYDTALAESGGNLSQGQRQLIAIARAVLTAPALLVLDEATSSVDARTELRIQQGMLKLRQGRTSFLIAHRLSTIRDADLVVVVEGGAIVERGSPDELRRRDGYYQRLYQTQQGGVAI